jgi:hypothetical protein
MNRKRVMFYQERGVAEACLWLVLRRMMTTQAPRLLLRIF